MEEEILKALAKYNTNTIIHLNVTSFSEPEKFLEKIKYHIRNKIVVILPSEGADNMLESIKLFAMSNFSNISIIAFRSFSIGKDEVMLGF